MGPKVHHDDVKLDDSLEGAEWGSLCRINDTIDLMVHLKELLRDSLILH
jgi:hypothetical protein